MQNTTKIDQDDDDYDDCDDDKLDSLTLQQKKKMLKMNLLLESG